MKKILLFLGLILVSNAKAQKGSVLVVGNISYSSSVTESQNSYKKFVFNPKVGYQFSNSWTIGVESYVASAKFEVDTNTSKLNEFSIGPFLRYTKPLNDLVSIYGDFGIGHREYKTRNTSIGGSGTARGNGFYTYINPAVSINVKKGLGLNFGLGGISYETMDNDFGDGRYFNFDLGKTITVGILKNFM
jgi:hypothetical protein